MSFVESFLLETREILSSLRVPAIEQCIRVLSSVRERGGRLFILGVGGSASNASHAVNDFRKLCQFESYCPTDNVAELTARTNDDGWQSTFAEWLRGSRLSSQDGLLVFSVGGGDLRRNISPNIVDGVRFARSAGASVVGVLGRSDGFVATEADACVVLPEDCVRNLTPQAEILQAVMIHLFVTHPALKVHVTKWEQSE